ncbi:hypothetical protein M8A51_14635 [Schlegelella sp. S2-27]|uniref:Uncharacterized protein n=1 Tax=Caldimonas mangrovi TaxID=2944811 RepID=A0ABT0YQQ9_9BURK|nr:hypothetical protein [Caldimonas mangrovi]MCM5680759.1 hypothetical protein [Caldimonas mangrovi]
MGLLDAFWHLLNFFAPAVGVGLLSAALAKLTWRRALQGVGWRRLVGWGCVGAALALVGGLIFFGRDGRVLTYLFMVAATATALWWAGFGLRSRA